jgi:hypothetical protein
MEKNQWIICPESELDKAGNAEEESGNHVFF